MAPTNKSVVGLPCQNAQASASESQGANLPNQRQIFRSCRRGGPPVQAMQLKVLHALAAGTAGHPSGPNMLFKHSFKLSRTSPELGGRGTQYGFLQSARPWAWTKGNMKVPTRNYRTSTLAMNLLRINVVFARRFCVIAGILC